MISAFYVEEVTTNLLLNFVVIAFQQMCLLCVTVNRFRILGRLVKAILHGECTNDLEQTTSIHFLPHIKNLPCIISTNCLLIMKYQFVVSKAQLL